MYLCNRYNAITRPGDTLPAASMPTDAVFQYLCTQHTTISVSDIGRSVKINWPKKSILFYSILFMATTTN